MSIYKQFGSNINLLLYGYGAALYSLLWPTILMEATPCTAISVKRNGPTVDERDFMITTCWANCEWSRPQWCAFMRKKLMTYT